MEESSIVFWCCFLVFVLQTFAMIFIICLVTDLNVQNGLCANNEKVFYTSDLDVF